jgi:prepilin-type N-terminal cleavage/methylation domain-containing protein
MGQRERRIALCRAVALREGGFTLLSVRAFPRRAVALREGWLAKADRRSRAIRSLAFTLLELLVVIAIISILLVAVIPAVTSLSKSSGRKGAISLLLGVLEQARSLAIKDGRPTYVVFPAGTPATSDQNIISRYFYHSVAIFEDEEDPANPGTFKQNQKSEWKVLPTGISLRSAISASPWATNISFTFTPEGSSTTEKFPYLKFNASGQVESPAPSNNQVQVRIFEGYVSSGSEHVTSSKNFDESIAISTVSGRSIYTSANQ